MSTIVQPKDAVSVVIAVKCYCVDRKQRLCFVVRIGHIGRSLSFRTKEYERAVSNCDNMLMCSTMGIG